MYKKLFFIFVFVTIALTQTQPAAADYRITNGSATETAWAVYSVWEPASGVWPEGWRTQGWYKIEPRETINLSIHRDNTWVYIRVERADGEVKPLDHTTRDAALFWIHRSEAFTVVETAEGDFLKSDHDKRSLEQQTLYEYRDGGSHTIADEPRLRDLPAQQIYDQGMQSVVWIETIQENGFGKGSGVLIDKERRLVVTNEHVIRNARDIYVFFPWSERDGTLNKEEDFYLANWERLENRGYASGGRVIAQNVRNDLAIVQLNQLPPTAREIKHDFSRHVEDSMKRGDKVHILGNPGNRLWNWTQGTFVASGASCLPSRGACFEMEGDAHGGNSGGPVLNGQGMLIGILAAGTDETVAVAVPTRNLKALLDTLRLRHVFKIRNRTEIIMPYEIKWSNSDNWQPYSLAQNYVRIHWMERDKIPLGYPQIRFDHIGGDRQVTYRTYKVDVSLTYSQNNDDVLTYRFEFVTRNQLDFFLDVGAAPALSKVLPKETVLLSNYPNPFNPETWIPYQLSKPAQVTVTLYSADGRLVRTLALGHQLAGVYQNKSRAAYWDGKNNLGEPVASGVYFYTLKVSGDFTATRKMLIRK